MTTKHSRRSLLTGKLSHPETPQMWPPGAQTGFADLCSQCGDCARACPEGIIIRHASGQPALDFTQGGCTFCNACAQACETGALVPADPADWPWRAQINDSCLSLNAVACRACEDICEPRAIRFRPMTGGRSAPVLDPENCTGCGECSATCPIGAIAFALPAPAKEKVA